MRAGDRIKDLFCSQQSRGNDVTTEAASEENVITIVLFCFVYFDIETKIPLVPFTSILPPIL